MDDTPIRVCATADTLTLYWDKPAGAPADCRWYLMKFTVAITGTPCPPAH